MQFYSQLALADSKFENNRGWRGVLVAPEPGEIKLTERTLNWSNKEKVPEQTKLEYNTHFRHEGEVTLTLIATITYPSKEFPPQRVTLGSVTLSCVNSNCGTLHMSYLNSCFPKLGIGTSIMKQVLNFAQQAGYTMLLFNTANIIQNKQVGVDFFEKHFKAERITEFQNKRSGNHNIFYRIII